MRCWWRLVAVAQIGRAGSGAVNGSRYLLWRSYDRGDVNERRGCVCCRRRKQCGTSGHVFSRYARRVVILVRGSSLAASMSQYLINELKATPNIQIEFNSSVVEAHGDNHLEEISIHCADTNEVNNPANALFIMIGAARNTEWLANIVERDERGFIYSGAQLTREGKRPNGWKLDRDQASETNVPGIFVVGDVRHGSVKRVASGVGEGSVAISLVHQYLSKVV